MSTTHKFEKKRHTKSLVVPKQVLMEFQCGQNTEESSVNFERVLKVSEDFIHRFKKPLAHLVKG